MLKNDCQLGNLKLEGKKPTPKGLKITSDYLEGNITSQQAIEQIIKHYLGGGSK